MDHLAPGSYARSANPTVRVSAGEGQYVFGNGISCWSLDQRSVKEVRMPHRRRGSQVPVQNPMLYVLAFLAMLVLLVLATKL
jgi:hypothetical protein